MVEVLKQFMVCPYESQGSHMQLLKINLLHRSTCKIMVSVKEYQIKYTHKLYS